MAITYNGLLSIGANKTGRYICPLCSKDRKKTNAKDFAVNYEEKEDMILYYCHHCDASGGISKNTNQKKEYIQKTQKIKVKEYVKPNIATDRFSSSQERLYNYFQKRGINKETLNKYEIKYEENGFIYFPYKKYNLQKKENELVNFKKKYVLPNPKNEKPKYLLQKNGELILYGMHLIPKGVKTLVITEGEIDALSVSQIGIHAVSIPNGAKSKNLEYLTNCWEWLEQFDNFIIFTDNDKDGGFCKHNLIERLGKERCKVLNWNFFEPITTETLKFKDANDILRYDPSGDTLKLFLDTADFMPTEGIVNLQEKTEDILRYYDTGFGKSYATGWKNVDEYINIKPGYVVVLTGHSSKGKSLFLDNLLYNLSIKHQHKHLICSFETTIQHHFSNFAEMYKEKQFSPSLTEFGIMKLSGLMDKTLETSLLIDGYINEDLVLTDKFKAIRDSNEFNITNILQRQRLRIYEYLKKVVDSSIKRYEMVDIINYWKNYLFMLDTNETWTVGDILEKAKIQIRKYGINTLTIDPYNMLSQADLGRSGREDLHISNIMTLLRNFAKEYNISIIIVVHPSKSSLNNLKDKNTGEVLDTQAPTLSDCSGGIAWHTKADLGLVIHRRKEEQLDKEFKILSNITEIHVDKIKNKSLGKASSGEVLKLRYNNKTYKLEDC